MKIQELKDRVRLAWKILKGRDGSLVRHAQTELKALGYFDGDPMNAAMAEDLLALMRVFSAQGHSGFSAGFCRSLFAKAAAYEPLGPLTGERNEWNEVGDGVWQNKRCSHVFWQADRFNGQPYDIEAVVFEEPDGARFTGRHSMTPITFPYVPRKVYAKVPEGATDEQRRLAAQEALAAA